MDVMGWPSPRLQATIAIRENPGPPLNIPVVGEGACPAQAPCIGVIVFQSVIGYADVATNIVVAVPAEIEESVSVAGIAHAPAAVGVQVHVEAGKIVVWGAGACTEMELASVVSGAAGWGAEHTAEILLAPPRRAKGQDRHSRHLTMGQYHSHMVFAI